ncbi:MAG: hypothetical protein FWD73_15590 [Polyangiaceae bacterium]|nr:hypothetical protein [Polyangiaceae bacterium]
MKISSIVRLLVAVGCLASCATPFGEAPGPDGGSSGKTNGDTDSGGGVLDGEVVDPGPTFSFAQTDGLAYVRQGQTTDVPINITRSITPGTDIKIDIIGVPNGVSVDPLTLTIPPGSSTGKFAVTVDTSTPQGELNVELQGLAEGASITVTKDLQLFVRGDPGTLDPTFESNGVYEDTVNDYTSRAIVAPQSNGTILVSAWNDTKGKGLVIRLNADGVADPTLSESDIKNIPSVLSGVAAYPDGRIVGIGMPYRTVNRYTANGALDTTFNATGSVDVNSSSFPKSVPNGSMYLSAVAAGENDSIYVGGSDFVSSDSKLYAFLQIPANGQGSMSGCSGFLDNTAPSTSQSITNLALLPTGALAFVSTGGRIGVGRYLHPQSSCDLDPTYGNQGIWYYADYSSLPDAVFEADGSVDLLVGKASTSPTVYSLVHIEPDGQHAAQVDLPLGGSYTGITRAPDTRYLVAGQFQPAANASMDVAYYKSDLTSDTSVGNQNGIVTILVHTDLANPTGTGLRAVYTPDGERTIVVGSISGTTAGPYVQHFVVARIWN